MSRPRYSNPTRAQQTDRLPAGSQKQSIESLGNKAWRIDRRTRIETAVSKGHPMISQIRHNAETCEFSEGNRERSGSFFCRRTSRMPARLPSEIRSTNETEEDQPR